MTEKITVVQCPQGCRCDHMLTCVRNGKRTCGLSEIDCALKHTNHVCGHRWSGHMVRLSKQEQAVVCLDCGLDYGSHALMYGP